MDSSDPTTIADDTLLSPFMAAEHGLTNEQLLSFLQRFNAQPQPVREFVTSMDTYAAVKEAVTNGSIPPAYAVAVAKLVTYLAFDEVRSSQVPQLLEKLGVPPAHAAGITRALAAILKPLSTQTSGTQGSPVAPEMRPLPPLTPRIPAPAQPGSGTGGRNIIDLRTTPNT